MTLGAIDKAAPLPLYHQVYARLRDGIVAGQYRPGEPLPSERDLVKLYGVSRITAKRAVEQLAAEGLVVREIGRGSYVSQRADPPPLPGNLQAVIDNVVSIGALTEGHLIELARVVPPADVRAALGLGPNERVQRSIHTRSRDGVPLGLFTTHVPGEISRRISAADIERAPMLVLLEEKGVRPAWATQGIGAANADAPTARALGVAPGAPLVRLQRVVYDESDRPVEHLVALYRGDRYEYRTLLRRDGAGERSWRVS